MLKNLFGCVSALLLAATLTLSVGAQSMASVIRVEGPLITLNSGQKDQLQAGQTLFVSRMGQAVAEIKIESVGEFSSRARLVRNIGTDYILAGDQVQIKLPAANANPVSTVATIPVVPSRNPLPVAAPPVATPGPASLQLTAEQAEQNYRQAYQSRTKRKGFKQTAVSRKGYDTVLPGSEALNIYVAADSLASNFGPGGFYGNPAMLLFSAGTAIQAQKQREALFGQIEASCEIEATYWDLPLMETYAQYVAVTSGQTSPSAYATLRKNLISQKGLDNSQVFEVRLKNKGKVKVQLSPFHWHMFLQGPNNSRMAASRYDQVLDRQLNPGEEVAGNVYYEKLATLGDKVTVFFEDVYGDKASEDFPLH